MDKVERKLKDDLRIMQNIRDDYSKKVTEVKMVLESYQAQKAITKLNGGNRNGRKWFFGLF
jgi:hypothetical protein